MRAGRLTFLAIVLFSSCTRPPAVSSVRFRNQAPITRVSDRNDVPSPPKERPFPEKLYFFDAVVFDRVDDYMALETPRRAMNVNSLGGVPDSTWFTNRIGIRDLSLDEIRLGPNQYEFPDLSQGLKVTGSKVGGGSAGFIIEDGRGDRYIVKFDESHAPVTESATDVAVQRLLWACGYNVPENSIIYFRREDVRLQRNATVKDVFGNKRRMTDADVDEQLARSYVKADGTYRALASKFLPGVPIGGFAMRGLRTDDPNDLIPHEHRREVRALFLIFGWVQQTDAKEDNTLDLYVEGDDGRHYVKHYLVDFGKSFGTSGLIVKRPGDGHVENLDFEFLFKSLLTFGLWKRPYEDTPAPGLEIQGLGLFDAAHYSPGAWKSHAPYRPFDFVDRFDLYWAAKILIRFTEAQIRTALEQGRFEDPRAAEYLTKTLVGRQRRAAAFAFGQVNPLDNFHVSRETGGYRLCFDDLLVRHRLAEGTRGAPEYVATQYDASGVATGWRATSTPSEDRTGCFAGLRPSSSKEGYTILKLDTIRGDDRLSPVEVHLALAPTDGRLRIVGVRRR